MLNQDWDIKPRGLACAQCQGAFVDQQPYVSQLTFGAEGYQRRDYCAVCWGKGDAAVNNVSVWKSVFHPPPPPPEEPLKKETAESLLRGLIEKNEPEKKNVIFILAVMLERRRLLVERDAQARDDGSTLRVYEHRHTGDTFLITDPNLDLNQLSHVQEEVMAMLGGKSETAEPAPPPDTVQHSTSSVPS